MKVLVPIPYYLFTSFSSSGLNASNYAAWAAGTSYVAGARVSRGDSEYEALAASQGVDPSVPAESPLWVRLGAINRLKAFDETIYDQAVGNGGAAYFAYTITAPTAVTAVAFFNLEARSVRVILKDAATNATLDTRTVDLIDDAGIQNWSDYFFEAPSAITETLIDDLVAYPGTKIIVRVDAPGVAVPKVGQIVLGKSHLIGTLCEGTVIGIQDYSRKERDDWGNPIIVERPFAQRVEYDIAIPTQAVRSIQKTLSAVRARAAVYYDADQSANLGTTVYGYFQDFSTSLTVGEVSRMNLEVEGLV